MIKLLDSPVNAGSRYDEGAHWLSISDLMAGLMMVFLFISVALMRQAFVERDAAISERDRIEEIATVYRDTRSAIYERLNDEFRDDLDGWDASIDRASLSVDFAAPEVLFETGRSALRPRFQETLHSFFPRYVAVLADFSEAVEEVRIEGHTSSEWNRSTSETDAYFHNMRLSQERTRAVLQFGYRLPATHSRAPWVKRTFSAVGYSSARPISNDEGLEDAAASRRVSFRVMTNAEKRIAAILEAP